MEIRRIFLTNTEFCTLNNIGITLYFSNKTLLIAACEWGFLHGVFRDSCIKTPFRNIVRIIFFQEFKALLVGMK